MSTIRVACVTGAAQGIGRAIALRLAADGCNVAIGDLPAKMALLEVLVDEIQSKFRVKCVAISVDVTDEGDVDNLITTTVHQLGGLDVVCGFRIPHSPCLAYHAFEMVANAGVATLGNILDSRFSAYCSWGVASALIASVAELERVHAVNVKGTFICYKAAAKAMIAENRGGVIIGIPPRCSWHSYANSTRRFFLGGKER